MYPGRLGLEAAIKRIKALLRNGHSAEAMVTSIFTMEKLVKRGTRRIIQKSGKTFEESKALVDKPGFDDLRKLWKKFDPNNQGPDGLVAKDDWDKVLQTKSMRNDMVHGRRVYGLKKCAARSKHVIKVLRTLRAGYIAEYGLDPWRVSLKLKK